VDQALKQLKARIKPLRQFLEGQENDLERVGMHLKTELTDGADPAARFAPPGRPEAVAQRT
jgi:hypothetical protein